MDDYLDIRRLVWKRAFVSQRRAVHGNAQNRWMPREDSNLNRRYQKPQSYH